jgi:hypothetical protein
MCDAPETSREHVPPKCFFPKEADALDGKDLRKDLITVPSCDVHNTQKSLDDEYLRLILLATEEINEHGHQMIRTVLNRSRERRPALTNDFMAGTIPVTRNRNGEWYETALAHFKPERAYRVLDMLGRALYFHVFAKQWRGYVSPFCHFASFDPLIANARLNLHWQQTLEISDTGFKGRPSNGANPEIFYYQTVDEGDAALMRATFYGRAVVTFAYTASPMAGDISSPYPAT